MKKSRLTARLISFAAAVFFAVSASAAAFAEGSDAWVNPLQTTSATTDPIEEDPEEAEETEPEETEAPPIETTVPAAALDTDEPEDPEAPEDSDDPEDEESPDTTEPPVTTAAPPPPAASYTPEGETIMYAPQVINIRSGPGTDYDKLGVLYANSEITVIGSSGEWAAVSYNGTTGYILRSLLSSTPPATTTTAARPPETTPAESEAPTDTEPPRTVDTEPPVETPEVTTASAPAYISEDTTARTPAVTAPIASAQQPGGGGLSPFLIALLSAAGAFLLIGVVPVLIHRVNHKNLYRY